MSTTRLFDLLISTIASTLLPTVVLAAPAPLPCDEHASPQKGRPATFTATAMAVIGDVPTPDGSRRPMRIEVRVENGKVSAEIDGAKVAADRIVLEEGRVVILGDDGAPIRELPMVTVEPSGAIRMVLESVEALRRHVGDLATWSIDVADGEALPAAIRAQALHEAARAGAYARRFFGDQIEVDVVDIVRGDDGASERSAMAVVEAPRTMVGVTLAAPDESLLRHLDLQPGHATMLTGIVDGLPAAEAGLEPFDIVVAIDGRSPSGPQALREALAKGDPGDVVRLTVLRAGERLDVDVTLAPFDPSRRSAPFTTAWARPSVGEMTPGFGLARPGAPGSITGPGTPSVGSPGRPSGGPAGGPVGGALPGRFQVAPMPGGGERFLYQIDVSGGSVRVGPDGSGQPADGGDSSRAQGRAGSSGASSIGPSSTGPSSTDARLKQVEARLDELTRSLERLLEKLGA